MRQARLYNRSTAAPTHVTRRITLTETAVLAADLSMLVVPLPVL